MRIEIDSLDSSSGAFTHVYRDNELDLDDERVRLLEPPDISGQVKRKGDGVILNGRLVAKVEVDCDRCLQSVEVPVSSEFTVQYVTEADYGLPHAAELGEADLGLSVFDGDSIDVDELVREQVLLAVPTRALCGEDCKGFCSVCGADEI